MKFDHTIDEKSRDSYVGQRASVLDLIEAGDIPLSTNIMKKIFGNKTVSSFHITSLEKLNQLKKLEGRRASLASFNKLKNSVDKKMDLTGGPLTSGGVFVWLDGGMVARFSSDAMTLVDKGGRRWVSWDVLVDKVKYPNELVKISEHFTLLNTYGTPSEKQRFAKKYITTAYKYLLKYKDEIVKKSISDEIEQKDLDPFDLSGSWNEIVLNNIKVKGLVILDPSVHKHDALGRFYTTLTQKEFDVELKKVKKLFPGVKIIVTKDTKAFKKYFKKWGGDLVLDHYII